MEKHILIMEDDEDIQEVIKEFLLAKDYLVTTASDGLEGLKQFNNKKFDLVILDIMMPNLNGYEVAKAIRKKDKVPIIMLTALGDEQDQVKGFDLGIDDYITKPFSFEILIKRVEAVLRRSSADKIATNIYTFNELRIDCDSYKAYINNEEVILTTKEFEIIKILLENPCRVITRESMLDNLWGYDFYGDARLIDTHIKNIRKKLKVPYIKTIKGVGYKIDE
ncbi:response regulator transcription factor [Clostridium sp. AL.422]|uniref:response regulator transcription factor n=1 Tax=Clostridium TaxID=1485 RepID=UPI00293DB158|nr:MULTISPECIES: response regulator transcription factor [unclassified Clostridium]MDV4151321.1 response regulator transcription factor [Clostridium sp. AL.422]